MLLKRRKFLKLSGAVVAGLSVVSSGSVPRVHAGENNTIPIALVGCGGRGRGAVQDAFSANPCVKLIALADVFPDRPITTAEAYQDQYPDRVDLSQDRLFSGFDSYKHAIEAVGPGGVVFLCTPPSFRPPHFEYAVEKGVHVFMEKSFGVDVPGIKRIIKTGEEATKKNLKVAGGLMNQHNVALQKGIAEIHNGAIGQITSLWAYRVHEQVPYIPRIDGENELAHQIRNYHNFNWANGTFIVDWLIHNLEVACWAKGGWPISAQGQGGRQVRTEPDQQFDHFAVEYTFADGARLMTQGRAQNNTWNAYGVTAYGTNGSADLGGVIGKPTLYRDYLQKKENICWQYEPENPNPYKQEHVVLFDSIINDKPQNESIECAYATMVGIMGRMASESGQMILWDEAMATGPSLVDIDSMTSWDALPPVMPDANGNYPIAKPGITPPA